MECFTPSPSLRVVVTSDSGRTTLAVACPGRSLRPRHALSCKMRIVKEQNVTAETAWSLAVRATRREPVNFPAFSLRTPKVFESYAAHGAPFILPPSSLILHVVFQSAAGIFFRFLFFGILGAKNRNARNAQRLARRPKSARPHASPEIDGWQPFGGARSVVTPPALLND